MPLANPPASSSTPSEAIYTQDQSPPNYLEGPGIVNEYRIVSGVCVLPIAEEPPTELNELKEWSPVKQMKLHSDYRIRTAKFSATKQNGTPILPFPGSTGAFIFTGGSLAFTNVYVDGQQYNWTCETVYKYIENCVSRNIDGYVLGTAPFLYPSQMESAAMGTVGVNSPGAISFAGADAKSGWATQAVVGPNGYNVISYFPGMFFNSEMMNSGVVQTASA